MKNKGAKGVLAQLKDFEKQIAKNEVLEEGKFVLPAAELKNSIQKNFRINEYEDKLLQVIQLKRGLTHSKILKNALELYATKEEKDLAKTLYSSL